MRRTAAATPPLDPPPSPAEPLQTEAAPAKFVPTELPASRPAQPLTMQRAPEPPRQSLPTHARGPLAFLATSLEIAVITLFAVTFIIQPFRIPSESMEPTLLAGDSLLMDKQSFAPDARLDRMLLPSTVVHRGDLAVFHFPADPSRFLIKRIIGLPGDRIRLHGGRVLLNGTPLAEPYAFYSGVRPNSFRDDFPSLREADPNADPRWWAQLRQSVQDGEITVPADEFFTMGDNRNNSEDSRFWGFVPRDLLVGRPMLVYFSAKPPEGGTGSALETGWRGTWTRLRRSIHIPR